MKNGRSYTAVIAIVVALAATDATAGLIGTVPGGEISYQAQTRYVTADDPANHEVPAGGFSGVAALTITRSDGTFLCSGALLGSGRHVVTAAHCVTNGAGALTATSVAAKFTLAGGDETVLSSAITVHPSWNGQFFVGNDIAIIELSAAAPAAAQRYDIYRGVADVGGIGDKVGFGASGTGATGATLSAGIKRSGQNKYDNLADAFLTAIGQAGFVPDGQLLYDFDNGLAANDGFGFFDPILGAGLADLGLGANEVMSGGGDSGSPTFIDGLIAGIASYGFTLMFVGGGTSDVDGLLNSSFGEFGADTRLTIYQDFIDDIVGRVVAVPEPAAQILLGSALLMLGLMRRLMRQRNG
ncbi:MAG: trypsin-like serine protease [Alphaproteobacteria bacterium]